MNNDSDIKLKLRVDSTNRWFVSVWIFVGKNKSRIEFKVDTGCNSLVLSHSTLKNLGITTSDME